MYLLSLKQVGIQAISIAIIISSLNIAYIEYIAFRNLPDVVMNEEGKCIKVVNYQNGDAYQCQDVGIVLRKFKTKKLQ